MASLIFDEGDSIAAPAKTPGPSKTPFAKSTRKVLGDTALGAPTPAARKQQPATTAKRVLFGDITQTAVNKARARDGPGAEPADAAAGKTPGRKITFATPAKTDRKAADEAKEEPAAEEYPAWLRQPPKQVSRWPDGRRKLYDPPGGYRDDTEPIERPCGKLYDEDKMLEMLDRLEAKRHPIPDIPIQEDGDDPVEEVLRKAGEPLITEEHENSLRRCEERLAEAEAQLPKPKVPADYYGAAPDDYGLDFAFGRMPDYSSGPLPPAIMEPWLCDEEFVEADDPDALVAERKAAAAAKAAAAVAGGADG